MKEGKSEIKNPFDDIAEKEVEKLAKKIYGGDKYTREVSEGDLKNMRAVYEDIIKRNKGNTDRPSIIETMVLQNNITLIDTEMKRRGLLNETGKWMWSTGRKLVQPSWRNNIYYESVPSRIILDWGEMNE